jgi:hypothetical protein
MDTSVSASTYFTIRKLDPSLTGQWDLSFNYVLPRRVNHASLTTNSLSLNFLYINGADLTYVKLGLDGSILSTQIIYTTPDPYIPVGLSSTLNTNDRLFYLLLQQNGTYVNTVGEIDTSANTILWSEDLSGAFYTSQPVTTSTPDYLWLFYASDIYHTRQYDLQETVIITETICDISYGIVCDISYGTVCVEDTKQICVENPIKCCHTPTESRETSTVAESDYLLSKLAACPIYHINNDTGGTCINTRAALRPTTRSLVIPVVVSSPSHLHQARSHHRIHGIDEVARLVRSPASSTVTARTRVNLQNFKPSRHSEHFRNRPPLPPCPVPHFKQPGVPIAPQTPCNPGNQTVDYSNPLA